MRLCCSVHTRQHRLPMLKFGDLQDIHDVLYGDGAFIKAFHDSCGSGNVSVSDWQNGTRLVSFELRLTRAPTFITSITGSQVNIVDRQACVWEPATPASSCDSDTARAHTSATAPGFQVSSTPEVQISGGKRFVSNLCISFVQHSCDVHARGSVEVAANIWGLQGSIEPVMLREARTQLVSFFAFARHYYYTATKPGIHIISGTPAGSTIAPSLDVQPTSPLSGASSSEAAAVVPADVLSTQALPSQALPAPPSPPPPQRVRSAGQSLSRSASPHSEDFQDVMDYASSDVRILSVLACHFRPDTFICGSTLDALDGCQCDQRALLDLSPGR